MEAIPTIYKGRRYRSRLEARWAAMFDLLRWRVEYEPIDFNGWIPDFVINEAEEVFVEVKPVPRFPKQAAEKIDQSGCPNEVLIVGHSIPIVEGYDGFSGEEHGATYLGWLREIYPDNQVAWGLAECGLWLGDEGILTTGRIRVGNPDNLIGFCHAVQSYRDRVTGFYDGGSYGAGSYGAFNVSATIQRYWQEAGNMVQWRSPL